MNHTLHQSFLLHQSLAQAAELVIQAIGESQQLGREVNEFLVTLINHSQLIEDNCANESCDTLDAVMFPLS